jgi:hypothetical protein
MSNSGFPFFANPQVPFNPDKFDQTFPTMFLFLYPAMMCFSLGQLALQVFYIVLAVKNKELTDTVRILFIIGMFFMPFIAMPIYFVVYFWNEDSQYWNNQQSKINNTQSLEPAIDKIKKVKSEGTKRSPAKSNIGKTMKKASVVKKSSANRK